MGLLGELWWSSRAGFVFGEVVDDFRYHSGFGNEGQDPKSPTAVAKERVGFEDPFDQISPSFSESGPLLGRELGFVC